ncbi:hypothetical protein KI440_03565 [Candidatus Saccharibacteria bacterium TM7i]|nr:hypothetical protein KI440_03565 [Candidatus Saccharibacteria bacterium TM7i]
MNSEQFHANNPEVTANKEPNLEAEKQYEKVGEAYEQAAEKAGIENGEQAAEKAKVEALEQAVSVERGSAEKKRKEPSSSPAQRRHGVVSKKEREASYKQHLKQIRTEMPASQRAFSKFIHSPAVEKVSEVAGATIARPNSILAGAIVAFFAVLAVYLIAKHYGYPLSGFETIGAFIAGWIIGALYDFFRVMITGKRS